MSYDTWKTTNPDDEFLGPEPSPHRETYFRVMGHCPKCNRDLYSSGCPKCDEPQEDINF